MSPRARLSLERRVHKQLAWLLVGVLIAGGILLTSASLGAAPEDAPPRVVPRASSEGVILARPTVTPTQTATPTPTASPSAPAEAVVCSTARILAPSINLDARIDEYTYEQMIADGGINPPEAHLDRAVWYSGFYRKAGLDSVMSATARHPVYIAGHHYSDASYGAVFDHIEKLKVGEIVTVKTCTGERIVLKVVKKPFNVAADKISNDPRVYPEKPIPGRWYLVTCNSDDGPRENGLPTENTVVTLQVQHP